MQFKSGDLVTLVSNEYVPSMFRKPVYKIIELHTNGVLALLDLSTEAASLVWWVPLDALVKKGTPFKRKYRDFSWE